MVRTGQACVFLIDRPKGDAVKKGTVARRAASAAAVGFAALAVFELALAAGAPLGRAAWGGTQAELPMSLRLASAVAVTFYGLAAVVVLRRAGFRIGWVPRAAARDGTWILVVILPLSAIVNVLSPSPWERILMAPTAMALAALCLIVARSAHDTGGSASGEEDRREGIGSRRPDGQRTSSIGLTASLAAWTMRCSRSRAHET